MAHSVDEPIRLEATFEVSGTPTDPTAIVLMIQAPDGTREERNWPPADLIQRDGPGAFHSVLQPDEPGYWRAQWTGTGDAGMVAEQVLEVRPSVFDRSAETLEALARLREMTSAEGDPPLSDDELLKLLDRNQQEDAEGRRPADDGWAPSYALGAAAEDGWLLKAGKVAARVDGGSGGMTLARSQLYAHCMDMAERYSMRRSTSLPLAPTVLGRRLPVFNRNDPYFPNPLPDEVGGAL